MTSEATPVFSHLKARLTGIFYLGTIAAGVFAEAVVRGSLVVPGNGRETAANISRHEWLYRAGEVSDLVMLACYIVVTALLYELFAASSRSLSLTAAGFSLTGVATLAANGLLHMAPLALLDGAPHRGIGMAETQSLVQLSLRLHGQVYGISLVFFGIYCMLLGWLAIHSGRLPRWLGALMIAGGLCHLVSRTAALLAPDLARALPSQIGMIPLLAELAFALWLLIVGARPSDRPHPDLAVRRFFPHRSAKGGPMVDDCITITSGDLTAAINPLGAELWSLKDALGRELMTDADPRWWTGRAPLLFPVVGRVREDHYRVDGHEFALPQHGFARRKPFSAVTQDGSSAAFRLEADGETLAAYPFYFRLDMVFDLEGATLRMTATVTNRGERPMPFSFGYHPAFAWPLPYGAAAADHRITFEKDEPAPIRKVGHEPGLIALDSVPSPVTGNVLAPTHAMFEGDALIWEELESRSLTWGAPGAPSLRIDFPDTPWLGLWQKPGARYLCVEPWAGMADPVGFAGDIHEKPGIMVLVPGDARSFRMDVTLVDV